MPDKEIQVERSRRQWSDNYAMVIGIAFCLNAVVIFIWRRR